MILHPISLALPQNVPFVARLLSACISASITTVFDSRLVLCVRVSSSSEIILCAQCSFFTLNLPVSDSVLFSCACRSSSSEIIACAQYSFLFTVFTVIPSVISPIFKRSISWWLTGWWSDSTHTVFLGDDEDDWWLHMWWSKSLWRDVRVSTQGSIRFPHCDSALPQSIPAFGQLSAGVSSFSMFLVRKPILVH